MTASAGVLDIHVMLYLQGGWATYGDPSNPGAQAAFAKLFPRVKPSLVARWWAELSRHKPVFNPAEQPRTPRSTGEDPNLIPMVIVELDTEDNDVDLIGEAGRYDPVSGKLIHGEFHRQRAVVTIFARSPSLARSLYVLFRDTLMLAQHDFIEEGYTNLYFVNGGRLEPEEELIAEQAGLYGRRMVWEARALIELVTTEPAEAKRGWFVNTDDVTNDGDTGGVGVVTE